MMGNLKIEKLTFAQWINAEYGIVKRQYKEFSDRRKNILKEEYQKYLNESERDN